MRKGFTLIELLVVIAIIAILAAILFPVFTAAKEKGRVVKCVSNLKQIQTANSMYVDDYNGRFMSAQSASKIVFLKIFGPGAYDQATGPFQQDILKPYIKNRGIWMCPSININVKLPMAYGSNAYQLLRWTWSGGGTGGPEEQTYSNYCWIYNRFSMKGTIALGKEDWPLINGALSSEVMRPTKAPMFVEIPSWDTPGKPHKNGVNVVFFDGHVKQYLAAEREDVMYSLWIREKCYQGWE